MLHKDIRKAFRSKNPSVSSSHNAHLHGRGREMFGLHLVSTQGPEDFLDGFLPRPDSWCIFSVHLRMRIATTRTRRKCKPPSPPSEHRCRPLRCRSSRRYPGCFRSSPRGCRSHQEGFGARESLNLWQSREAKLPLQTPHCLEIGLPWSTFSMATRVYWWWRA